MITDSLRRKLLEDHLTLGAKKCMSYLPRQTIETILQMTLADYAEAAKARGLRNLTIEEGSAAVRSGAVYVYSDHHLSLLIKRHEEILRASNWPTDNEGFVRRAAREWLDDTHPAMPIVREAFDDL